MRHLPFLASRWLSADPAAVFDALLVRPSRSTFDAALAADLLVALRAIAVLLVKRGTLAWIETRYTASCKQCCKSLRFASFLGEGRSSWCMRNAVPRQRFDRLTVSAVGRSSLSCATSSIDIYICILPRLGPARRGGREHSDQAMCEPRFIRHRSSPPQPRPQIRSAHRPRCKRRGISWHR